MNRRASHTKIYKLRNQKAPQIYSANDIAIYILSYYRSKKIYINNLKLQKLLYYIQVNTIVKLNRPCFKDGIEAWPHGPAVPVVYYHYNWFLAEHIISFDNFDDIDARQKQIIHEVLDKYQDTDPWDLVKKTCSETPWKLAHKNEKDQHITPQIIKKCIDIRCGVDGYKCR